MSTTLKANSRGSRANVCSFAPDQIERIKDGCASSPSQRPHRELQDRHDHA